MVKKYNPKITNPINELNKIFWEIARKPIFVCGEQTIYHKGKAYKHMPRCEWVQLTFEDWYKLQNAILNIKPEPQNMIWRHNLYIKDKKLATWLEKNLIYCEDTHSFVHRLFNKIKDDKKCTYVSAQNYAFQILADMIREYKEKPKIKMENRLIFIGDLPVPKPPKGMMRKK